MVDLLKQVFEAKELRKYERPDGSIMHVEVQIDDSVIMMGDSSNEFPATKQLLHVYIDNVDEIFQTAISAGCKPIEAPKEREGDPDRRGSFEDFAGNIWSVATQKESV
jgi:uncharacterized glyoxalase superfamily protein PhnB